MAHSKRVFDQWAVNGYVFVTFQALLRNVYNLVRTMKPQMHRHNSPQTGDRASTPRLRSGTKREIVLPSDVRTLSDLKLCARLHSMGIDLSKEPLGEMVPLFDPSENREFIRYLRRSVAEGHFNLGRVAEADRLFEQWLEEEPDWTWGWIGWADCYAFTLHRSEPVDLPKATRLLTHGLKLGTNEEKRDDSHATG